MAFLTATPNPVPVSAWLRIPKGKTEIRWGTESAIHAKVHLSIDGGPETVWDDGGGPGGSPINRTPPKSLDVELGRTYVLRLRDAANPTTVLATLNIGTVERTGLPTGLRTALQDRVPFSQGITNIAVTPGVDSVRIQFKTRQPTYPVLEITVAATQALVGAALPLSSGARTVHDITLADGLWLSESLGQDTNHGFRIIAPALDNTQPPKEVAGLFQTGTRSANVVFSNMWMNDDGDPGSYGDGDFDFWFGAGDVDGPAVAEVAFSKDISTNEFVTLNRSVFLPRVGSEMFVQVLSREDDVSEFGPFDQERSISFAPAGSTWKLYSEREISQVTQHFDVSDLAVGSKTIPFKLQTGPRHVDYDVNGHIEITAVPGVTLFVGPATTKSAKVRPLIEPSAMIRAGQRGAIGDEGRAAHLIQLLSGGSIYHQSVVGAGDDVQWKRLPVDAPGPVTVLAQEGTLHLFSVGPDGSLRYVSVTAKRKPTQKWRVLGTDLVGPVSATVMREGKIALWAIGTNGKTYQGVLADSKAPVWKTVGNAVVGGTLTAFSSTDGGTTLVGLDRERHVMHRRWSAGGRPEGDWSIVGTAPSGDFSVGMVDTNILAAGVLGSDESVQVLVWDNYPSPLKKAKWRSVGTLESLVNARYSVVAKPASETA